MRTILRDTLLALPGIIAVIERWGARAMDLIGLPAAAEQFKEWTDNYFPNIGDGTYFLIAFSAVGLSFVHLWPIKTKTESKIDKQALANNLKKKLSELDVLVSFSVSGSLVPIDPAEDGIRWERDTLKIMRGAGMPASEIHMFETISYIPRRGALVMRRAGPDTDAIEALKAKREKLRRIIARLLAEDEK